MLVPHTTNLASHQKPGAKMDWCLCSFDDFRQMSAAQHLGLLSSEHPETLVLYTYSNSDTEYERNLHYFVEHGMADGDGCDYVIIVQEVSNFLQTFNALPAYLTVVTWEALHINPYANPICCMTLGPQSVLIVLLSVHAAMLDSMPLA